MPSSKSRNDAAATPMTPRCHRLPETRPWLSNGVRARSRQRAPRPFTKFSHCKDAFDPFPGWRKLPGGIMVDTFVLANLRCSVHITLHAALNVRKIFVGGTELLLLLLA